MRVSSGGETWVKYNYTLLAKSDQPHGVLYPMGEQDLRQNSSTIDWQSILSDPTVRFPAKSRDYRCSILANVHKHNVC